MRIAVPPILAAIFLSWPCLGLGYFWDDFVFLNRVQSNPFGALGPEPGAFYRPLSRGVYFWPLAGLGSPGAIVAHLINLLLLAAAIYLLVSLASRLAGDLAGILTGFAFATLAPVPGLVAWASASQDLFAITFTLVALHLRDSGRLPAAGIAAAGGLLSKETAVCVIPLLILWDWILGRKPARIRTGVLLFGGLALAWLLLHPGIRELALRRFGSEPRGYVGFANAAVSQFYARRYALALLNATGAGPFVPWPAPYIAIGVLTSAIALAGTWLVARAEVARHSKPVSLWSIALMSVLIAGPALALPSLFIQRWAAYFVCMPALGSALLLGALFSRVPIALGAPVLVAYLWLGLWCRVSDVPGADALTERSFRNASGAIQRVERGFRKLHAAFPRGSRILVSVASSGPLGIDGTIHDGQALRVWYRDPTIHTLRPERRRAHGGREFLFRITSSQDVEEIDPDRGESRASGGSLDPDVTRAITRTYARGLAASGESDRSIRILNRLAAQDEGPLRSYDLRLAAIGPMALGRSRVAERLLALAPPITREFALYSVAKLMAEPTGRAEVDSCAFPAFGLSSGDPDAVRHLMELFYASLFVPQAIQLARQLQMLAPGDSESAAILREMGAARVSGGVPAPGTPKGR